MMKLFQWIVLFIAAFAVKCVEVQSGHEDSDEYYSEDQQLQSDSLDILGFPEPIPEEVEGQIVRVLQRGKCKAKSVCVLLGGMCITNTTYCNGRLVAGGCKPKKSNCTCCVPGTIKAELQNIEKELKLMRNNITNELLNQGTKLNSIKLHQGTIETKLQNSENELQLMKNNITAEHLYQKTKLDSIKLHQGTIEAKLQNSEKVLQLMKQNITDEHLNQETKLDSIKLHQAEACYSPGFKCAYGMGTCRPDSCNSTTENQNGTCGGVGCKCCTSKICFSPGTSCASGQGTCRPNSCNSTYEYQNGTCGGASCKCCKTKLCYTPGSSCASGQGSCRPNSCNATTEDQSGTCGGASCKCCKTKLCYTPGSSCASGQGTCRTNSCNSTTEDQSGTCGGASCKCCKSKLCYAPGSSCASGQGTCRPNSCNSTTEDQSGTCGGASCKCCKRILCAESEGYFKPEGSSQCYKAYLDQKRTWTAAGEHCKANGLVLAEPDNAIQLSQYLNENFGNKDYWLGAQGTGANYAWLRDGQKLSNNDPLWYPGQPDDSKSSKNCVFLAAGENWHNKHPRHPFLDWTCISDLYPLCELISE